MLRSRLISPMLGCIFALGLTGAALAQDNAAPQQQPQSPRGQHSMNPDRQLERLTSDLDLTQDQQSQIKPLLAERQQKGEAIFQDQSIPQQDRRAKMKAVNDEMRGKIEAVLNDQQKAKFEAMSQHMRGGGPNGGGQNGGAPPPQTPQ